MTKKDHAMQRLHQDDHLLSRSVACLPAARGKDAGNGPRTLSVPMADGSSALESYSMVTLADRVESWLHTTSSGVVRTERSGGEDKEALTSSRKSRPRRRPRRPDWNDSTCITPKPRPVSMLPLLPVHGFGCTCLGCQKISKARSERQNELMAPSGKQVTQLPSLIAQKSDKKHTRSSTFPMGSSPVWPVQTKTGRYTRSQLVANSQDTMSALHMGGRSLPGVSQQLVRSTIFEDREPDRQAQLLAWAESQKQPVLSGPHGGDKPARVKRQRPVFGRPSNRPDTVQKPITGTRLPKLPQCPVPSGERATDNPTLDRHSSKFTVDDSVDGGQMHPLRNVSPSVCMRVEQADNPVTQQDESSEGPDYETHTWASFYSESLSSHDLSSHSDTEDGEYNGENDECDDNEGEGEDGTFDEVHSLVTLVESESGDGAEDRIDSPPEQHQQPQTQPSKQAKPVRHLPGASYRGGDAVPLEVMSQDRSSESPQRSEELRELADFANWAERFGGGMKGISMASLIQDCRTAKTTRQKLPQRKDGEDRSSFTICRPSLTALVSDENVKTQLQLRQNQRHKTREIERIHQEILAMRQRYALQQQEVAIQQEISRSMVIQAMGASVPEDTSQTHSECASMDGSQHTCTSIALSAAENED